LENKAFVSGSVKGRILKKAFVGGGAVKVAGVSQAQKQKMDSRTKFAMERLQPTRLITQLVGWRA
jgi:hypothetical protein